MWKLHETLPLPLPTQIQNQYGKPLLHLFSFSIDYYREFRHCFWNLISHLFAQLCFYPSPPCVLLVRSFFVVDIC